MSKTVGILGLGIMGSAISRNLVERGWRVIGFDIDAGRRAEAAQANVTIAADAAQVAREAAIIMTSLPSPAAVMDVAQIIANSGQSPRIVVELSTLTLADKFRFEAILSKEHGWHSTADVDLVGEIKRSGSSLQFQRGVSDYPAIGDSASAIGPRELKLVYNVTSAAAVEIGHLQQDSTITAYVDIDDTLCKHFAILGTTGVGKSSAVVLLLQEIIRARPNLRILVLDAHNEYGRPFADRAVVLNPANLRLPFWLFNFEEMVDVLFGARPGSEKPRACRRATRSGVSIAARAGHSSTDWASQ